MNFTNLLQDCVSISNLFRILTNYDLFEILSNSSLSFTLEQKNKLKKILKERKITSQEVQEPVDALFKANQRKMAGTPSLSYRAIVVVIVAALLPIPSIELRKILKQDFNRNFPSHMMQKRLKTVRDFLKFQNLTIPQNYTEEQKNQIRAAKSTDDLKSLAKIWKRSLHALRQKRQDLLEKDGMNTKPNMTTFESKIVFPENWTAKLLYNSAAPTLKINWQGRLFLKAFVIKKRVMKLCNNAR